MAEVFYLRGQAERCRRLARDSTDPTLRDSLLRLAAEHISRTLARETDDLPVWQAGPDDNGACLTARSS